MRILLATHLFFPLHRAGTEVLTLELARSLRSNGHHVDIVTCTRHDEIDAGREPWLTEESYDDFKVFHINFGVRNDGSSMARQISAPDRLAILGNLAASLSPDIIHFHHLNGFSSAAIPAMKALGIPVFFTATDYWTICTRTTLFRPNLNSTCSGPETPAKCLACVTPLLPEWAAHAAMNISNDATAKLSRAVSQVYALKNRLANITTHVNAADMVFTSTAFQARMLEKFGVRQETIGTVPYGVRLGKLPPRVVLPEVFTAENRLKIVFIGSLIPIKGAHVLLEALRKLTPENLACIEVKIYGVSATVNSDYDILLKEHAGHLEGAASFSGTFPHDEIGTVLANAHLCIVPSIWYESAPLVLCSAIAAGTPAVVSDMSGMTEVIREGSNGISFPPGDSSQLANILIGLLEDNTWLLNATRDHTPDYRTPDDYCTDIEAEYSARLSRRQTHVE